MQLLLDSRAKTVPSNYTLRLLPSDVPGSEVPGYSITEEQWDKAKRQESPDYDWGGYQNTVCSPLFDHPSFATVEHDLEREWDAILNSLEPFNRRVV